MIADFIITFRETFEAALVVGIVLGYLSKTGQTKYNNVVYVGIAAGIIASVFAAFIFENIYGGFSGRGEMIFEGVTMFFGAFLLSTMIFWMMGQKHVAQDLRKNISLELSAKHKAGLFFLVFISILREGVETVIFLGAASFASGNSNLIGAVLGVSVAVLLGYAVFVGSMKINVKMFFNFTSLILIFFAAGLVAQGVHEFEEAGAIPVLIEHVWDINPPVNSDGSFPALHENGSVGSIFKSLFGYNGNPSLVEVLGYFAYISGAYFFWKRAGKNE
ncbi:MAG: FTR1 family protein [Candidatus Paceibacterota bacterium]|jgi:high-affinity iron transporter